MVTISHVKIGLNMNQVNIRKPNSIYTFTESLKVASNSQSACFHCGLTCINNLYQESGKTFCCTGCLTVYQFLNSQGMQDFYKIKEHPGNPSKEIKTESYQYEYLDDQELFEKIIDYKHDKISVITLKIPGIHCASCIWLLENLHQIHVGIRKVHVNFLKKEARIHFDISNLDI